MRGAVSLLFVALFLVLVALKLLGLLVKAGTAAFNGDIPGAMATLTSNEGRKTSLTATYLTTKLPMMRGTGMTDKELAFVVAYAICWTGFTWRNTTRETQQKRIQVVCSKLPLPDIDALAALGLAVECFPDIVENAATAASRDFQALMAAKV